jgi:hypothetical protein
VTDDPTRLQAELWETRRALQALRGSFDRIVHERDQARRETQTAFVDAAAIVDHLADTFSEATQKAWLQRDALRTAASLLRCHAIQKDPTDA